MSDTLVSDARVRIAAGFAAALLVLLVGGASSDAVARSSRAASLVSHTDSVLIERERLLSTLKDAETSSRGYVLTGDTTFLDPFKGAQAKLTALLKQLRASTADNPVQQERLDTLESVAAQAVSLSAQLVDYRRKGDFETARRLIATGQSKQVMEHAASILSQMEEDERALLDRRTEAQRESRIFAFSVIGIGSAVVFLLLVIINREPTPRFCQSGKPSLYT